MKEWMKVLGGFVSIMILCVLGGHGIYWYATRDARTATMVASRYLNIPTSQLYCDPEKQIIIRGKTLYPCYDMEETSVPGHPSVGLNIVCSATQCYPFSGRAW